MTEYRGLTDEQVMAVAIGLETRPKPRELHDYIESTRSYVNGDDTITIPQSHQGLKVGENHEGGHRLNYRIRQGASWLANARTQFRVTPGSANFKDQSEQMEKFARAGEAKLSRGKALHKWKQETSRDLFECGVSVVQQHPRREFYIKARADRTLMTRGARLDSVMWMRRVDPLHWWWDEDNEGGLAASMIKGSRELQEVASVIDAGRYDAVRSTFAFAESLPDDRFVAQGAAVETVELWLPDRGCLIYTGGGSGSGKGSRIKPDDPRRIVASWRNLQGKVPFYITPASPWPWTSPLDEMIALTGLRNFWATMIDQQASGAIFRHWQLKDTNSGDNIPVQLWSNPVPETVLLDLSKPPPNMGPGTEWILAPFEMHDVVPRYSLIRDQHESAGASIARLMGQLVNANTAVGTADMMEDYARREFADIITSAQDSAAERWEDTFRYLREYHAREPVVVAGRKRDPETNSFFQTHLELRGMDIVSEDVEAVLDTRSRLAMNADYQIGRAMRTNGDMSWDRAVEEGLVPFVDDAAEEKTAIFVDQTENVTLEMQVKAHAEAVAQNLGVGEGEAMAMPPPANMTRGNRTDPRSSGVGKGADNIGDTALAPGASDILRTA